LLPDNNPDAEFMILADLIDFGQDQLNQSMELFDEIQFDSFNFTGVLNDAALPFVVHNIFQKQDLYSKFNITVSTLYNFSREIA